MFKTFSILLTLFIKETLQFETNLTLSHFLSDYFSLKGIYSLKINHCHSKQEINLICGHFKGSGIKVKCENVYGKNWIHSAMDGGDYSKIGVYLDVDCLTNEKYNKIILNQIKLYSGTNYNWLLKTEKYNESFAFLNALPLKWDSQFSLMTGDGKIYEIRKEGKSKSLHLYNIATRSSRKIKTIKEVTEDLNGLVVNGFISVYGKHASSGILHYLRTKTNDPRDNLAKFSFVLHDLMLKKYNAKLKLFVVNQTESGKIYEFINGSLNYYSGGQFYALEKGSADIGLYPAEPLTAGVDKISILPSITTFRECFIFKHPKRFRKFADILTPFSGIVWCAVFVISAFFVCMLRLASCHFSDTESSTVFQIVLVISSLTQQGLIDTSNRISMKITYVSLLIFTTLVYAFYNASLLILMLSPTTKYLNSFDKLLNNDIQLGAEDIPLIRFQLTTNYTNVQKNSRSPDFSSHEMFYNLFEGVKMISEKPFAFFTHDSNILTIIETDFKEQDKCSLAEVSIFNPIAMSSFVRKDLPYKELLARGIMLLKESGIVSKESKFWFRKRVHCLWRDEYNVADFKTLYFAYAVYIFGVICSITLLGLELFYSNTSNKKIKK